MYYLGPPPLNSADEQVSSASIFEHVDRMSRSADGANKRLSSKIQLIAMQPMPVLPLPCPATDAKATDNAKMNKEVPQNTLPLAINQLGNWGIEIFTAPNLSRAVGTQ